MNDIKKGDYVEVWYLTKGRVFGEVIQTQRRVGKIVRAQIRWLGKRRKDRKVTWVDRYWMRSNDIRRLSALEALALQA